MTTFTEAKVCDVCGKLLRGVFFQGYTDPRKYVASNFYKLGSVVQWVTSLTADPGVTSLNPSWAT